MNLDKLKPAWKQFKFQNSLDSYSEEYITVLTQCENNLLGNKANRIVGNVVIFLILLICCQGG